jgi:hypothetical protein
MVIGFVQPLDNVALPPDWRSYSLNLPVSVGVWSMVHKHCSNSINILLLHSSTFCTLSVAFTQQYIRTCKFLLSPVWLIVGEEPSPALPQLAVLHLILAAVQLLSSCKYARRDLQEVLKSDWSDSFYSRMVQVQIRTTIIRWRCITRN